MSMLSAQCDELRSMAESVGLAMPRAATLMMEAADTILSLRDRAQDLQAENAKLREQAAEACMQLGGAWVRCTELRELARFIMHQCNDGNPRCSECIGWNDGECVALLRMCELGVEVDG